MTDINKKKIGSRKEVYYKFANKTSGGMKKDDIIQKNIIKKKEKKIKYLSRKISERMKHTPNLKKKKRTIINKRPKEKKYKSKKATDIHAKTKKKISFNITNTVVKEYYCSSLDENKIDSNNDDEDDEELYNINIDDIQKIDLTCIGK
jgi:hypothetical protein